MKKSILTLVGICFLVFSCQNELIEFQESDSLSFSSSSSLSVATVSCEPDLDALELSLPETVIVNTSATPCSEEGAFINVDIPDGSLASVGNPAWCADLDGFIGLSTYTFDVYSSYEDLSELVKNNGDILFENPYDFDRINWLLNQDIIGTESPNGGFYTFGHVQWAIWEIIEGTGNNCTDDCDYLSCNPINQWDNDKLDNERLGLELVVRADLEGEGFEPQCGDQIAIILASKTVQSLIITIDVPEKEIEEECFECEGKVTDLTLKYNGTEKAYIIVETKKEGEDGSKIVFEGMVDAGAEFSFTGNDKKGTLGTEITIYEDGNVNTTIHTSCSEPIGPGLISGNFEVISGSSREGGALCPVDTPPDNGDDCSECEGKVSRLDLQYNGGSAADIEVVQKKDNIVVFSGNVNDGDTFTFSGQDEKGTLGTEIIIYVNGVETQTIHTSCSVPIGGGSVFGDFTVMGGASREGGELCPVDTPPDNGDDYSECDTAFAIGNNNDGGEGDDTTCFLDDGFSRWGWRIGPLSVGEYTYDVYAGAGQCDTDKGELVGTATVNYNDGQVNVTYDIDDDYVVSETHTYAGKAMYPKTIKGENTVAPGQYTIESNLSGDIYVILHTVVCK